MSDNIVETQDIVFYYEGSGKPSMDKVSVTVKKGVKTVILGANGAGKSTLFYHFNGVVRPDEGRVLFDGEPVNYRRKGLRNLRSRIAVVLQNPDDQVFGMTVEADVAYGPTNIGMPKDEVAKVVDWALEEVGLTELRDRNTLQLSYGQRKRLALAGALAMRPEVLVMDEPTAGLDPQMALELMEMAEQLHSSGTTVVISTHDVDLAYAWADEIHVLMHGKLVFSGSSEDFYADAVQVNLAGLMPPSMFLMNSNLSAMRGVPASPYPRTETQMICKMASGPKGRFVVMPVRDRLDRYMADSVIGESGDFRIGVYGTLARSLVGSSDLPIDYVFDGFESCMSEALAGTDALLFCDESAVQIVERKVEALKAFDPDVTMELAENPLFR